MSPSGRSPPLLLDPPLLLLLLRIVPFRETSSKPLLVRLLNASGVPRFEEVKNTSRRKRICRRCWCCCWLLRIILSSPFFSSSPTFCVLADVSKRATKESKEKRTRDARAIDYSRQFFSSSSLCSLRSTKTFEITREALSCLSSISVRITWWSTTKRARVEMTSETRFDFFSILSLLLFAHH